MGDGIQAAKAGILEIGDIFVVNKADRDGADSTAREIRHMISLGQRTQSDWTPPILKTVASRGEGIADVVQAISDHRQWAQAGGEWDVRRARRSADEIEAIALARVRERFDTGIGGADLATLAVQLRDGHIDAYSAADQLLGESGA
jgi:LAO/AO transport system kinase